MGDGQPGDSGAAAAAAVEAPPAAAAEAIAKNLDCYMLVREQDGRWDEVDCPKPPRDAKGGPP